MTVRHAPSDTLRQGIRDAGFSLIELIVSLALLAMILALFPGAFHTGKRGWESAARLEQQAAAEASADFLRHRIAEAALLYDKDESGRSHLAFSGGPQALSFVAPAPSGPFGGGLYRFAVAIAPDAATGASALVLRMTPFRRQDSSAALPASERSLAAGIGILRLRYFGVNTAGGEAAWSEAWLREDELPGLIELDAVSSKSGASAFGPLRVELKMKAVAKSEAQR